MNTRLEHPWQQFTDAHIDFIASEIRRLHHRRVVRHRALLIGKCVAVASLVAYILMRMP